MPAYTQATRPLEVTTPLGPDKLLLTGFSGAEGLSQLYAFELDVLAEVRTEVPFDKLLGQAVSVRLELPGGKPRYFHGLCSRISQGSRDPDFVSYRLEVVPQFWLLTRKSQSRIFQHLTVPDIFKKVLEGLNVDYRIQGTFHPRDFVVQYRETDFAFASRLMEEEGIYYYFKHAADGHTLVLANTPEGHPEVPGGSRVTYLPLAEDISGERIHDFRKVQELRSSKVTLRDHCFELPHKHLEAGKTIQDSVQVGKVAHKLKAGSNGHLELYDWPGLYAQRFDGVDKGGGDRPGDLRKIFEDNERTAGIRMQEEAARGVALQGESNCRRLAAGHTFALEKHFNADGTYVLTGVRHAARNAPYRSGSEGEFVYRNTFTCIPAGLPFRPPRTTPRPVVHGTQTAVVVGPAGEEIFCDKYGRVKVQFHWDREGKSDANSSCWIRVATTWAGKKWGAVHVPRVGHEVIVDFLEGDPDQPIVVGSVYNADHMPPEELPKSRMVSGLKSNTTPGGGGYNEFVMDDTKGKELIRLHGQFDMDATIEHDLREHVLRDRSRDVTRNETVQIGEDHTQTVGMNRTRAVGLTEVVTVGSEQIVTIGKAQMVTVRKLQVTTVGKSQAIMVGANQVTTVRKNMSQVVRGKRSESTAKDQTEKVGGSLATSVTKDGSLKVGKKLLIDAGEEILIRTGAASIRMKKDGTIQISGKNITVDAKGEKVVRAGKNITMKGKKILQN